jgi:hypothetical protein
MENRHGLVVDLSISDPTLAAERQEALLLTRRARRRHRLKPRTLAGDRGYGTGAFLYEAEAQLGVVPLIPLMIEGPIRGSDPGSEARRRARRRKRSKSYQLAQRIRKRVEEIFGWAKTIGGLRRSRHVGRWKIGQQVLLVAAAYNLLRLARIRPEVQGA